MADDLPLLEELVDAGIVILTPAQVYYLLHLRHNRLIRKMVSVSLLVQDYDDSYCIEYATTHSGCIVSNDRYRDHVGMYQDVYILLFR